MRKFIQPVSMKVTPKQYADDLKESLEAMGYALKTLMSSNDTHLNTRRHQNDDEMFFGSDSGDRYFIDHYNPELYLALAAISTGEEFHVGEWGWENYSTPNFCKIVSIVESLLWFENEKKEQWSAHVSFFRKATMKELVDHFTKQDIPKEFWNPKNGEVIEVKYVSYGGQWVEAIYVGMLKGKIIAYIKEGQGGYLSEFTEMRPLPAKIELTIQELIEIAAKDKGITPDLIVVKP